MDEQSNFNVPLIETLQALGFVAVIVDSSGVVAALSSLAEDQFGLRTGLAFTDQIATIVPVAVREEVNEALFSKTNRLEPKLVGQRFLLNELNKEFRFRICSIPSHEGASLVLAEESPGLVHVTREHSLAKCSVLDHLTDVVFQLDDECRCKYINSSWERFTGRSTSACLGHPFTDFISIEDQIQFKMAFLALKRRMNDVVQLRVKFVGSEDELKFAELHCQAIRDSKGTLIGISGTAIDVSDRRLAVEAQRNQTRFEQEITKLSTEFIHVDVLDMASVTDRALRRICTLTEFDRAYIYLANHDTDKFSCFSFGKKRGLETKLDDFSGDEFVQKWLSRRISSTLPTIVIDANSPESIGSTEAEVLARRGYCSMVAIPLIAGGLPIGVFYAESHKPLERNILEMTSLVRLASNIFSGGLARREAELQVRKLGELRLAEAESQLSIILGNLPILLCSISRDGAIQIVQGRYPETLGIGSGSATGEAYETYFANTPEIVRDIRASFRGESIQREYEIGPNSYVFRIVPSEDGGVVIIGLDNTEHRRFEQALTQTRHLETIGQLAAGISHEINTPIQFIGDNLEFLRTSIDDMRAYHESCNNLIRRAKELSVCLPELSLIEETAKLINLDFAEEESVLAAQQGIEGVNRVAQIVKAMKLLSHPGSADRVDIDINKAVESTVIVSRNVHKYVAKVEMNLDDRSPRVKAYGDELNQVIMNLVVNATDAVAEHFKGTEDLGAIKISTLQLGDDVEIRVTDNGGGIPDAVISRVFDPFFTTKEPGKGSGQGLAICHSIVARHGGKIMIETDGVTETTMRVILPLSQPISGAEAA